MTYARQRMRHEIRHTAARAGRRLCPYVANGRLRHMLIGSARVSKADGSQVVAAQDEGVAQPILSAICPGVVARRNGPGRER